MTRSKAHCNPGHLAHECDNRLFSAFFNGLVLPGLVSLSLVAMFEDGQCAFSWEHDVFVDFITRSQLQNTLQELSLNDIDLSEQDLVAVFQSVPNLRKLEVSPLLIPEDPHMQAPGMAFPLTPRLLSHLIHVPFQTDSVDTIPNTPLLRLTHLRLWLSKGTDFSLADCLHTLVEVVQSRLLDNQQSVICRLQELEILNPLDLELEDQARAFEKFQEFRKKRLFFHAPNGT
jgi:hypothetical protein